jgi:hypothetical protein
MLMTNKDTRFIHKWFGRAVIGAGLSFDRWDSGAQKLFLGRKKYYLHGICEVLTAQNISWAPEKVHGRAESRRCWLSVLLARLHEARPNFCVLLLFKMIIV